MEWGEHIGPKGDRFGGSGAYKIQTHFPGLIHFYSSILLAQIQDDLLQLLGLNLVQGDKCPLTPCRSPIGCIGARTGTTASPQGYLVRIGLLVIQEGACYSLVQTIGQ